jgi:hypothetical protein
MLLPGLGWLLIVYQGYCIRANLIVINYSCYG